MNLCYGAFRQGMLGLEHAPRLASPDDFPGPSPRNAIHGILCSSGYAQRRDFHERLTKQRCSLDISSHCKVSRSAWTTRLQNDMPSGVYEFHYNGSYTRNFVVRNFGERGTTIGAPGETTGAAKTERGKEMWGGGQTGIRRIMSTVAERGFGP